MKLVEAQEGRRILDRLVGYEVSTVAFRRIGRGARRPGACRASRCGSSSTANARAWRSAAARTGTSKARSPRDDTDVPARRSSSSTASASRRAATSTPPPGGSRAGRRRRAPRRSRRGRARRPPRATPPFTVASVETRTVHRDARSAPFITSTLQQEAGRKLGFSAARTMARRAGPLRAWAHHLHAHRQHQPLGAGDRRAARSQIAQQYGDDYLPDRAARRTAAR